MTNIGLGEMAAEYTVDVPQINYRRASEYVALMEYLRVLSLRYRSVTLGSIGVSVMGREIPVITLGEKKSSQGVLYVGGYRGTDIMTPAVLLRFIGDYANYLETGRRIYSFSMPYLYETRTIHIVPMLNPDGYVIRREGVADIPNAEALTEKNGGEDFSAWEYSARGIDLARSFSLSGTFGEGIACANEPEASALCKYVAMSSVGVFGEIKLILSIGGEVGIRYRSRKSCPNRAKTVGRLLERMSGIEIDERDLIHGGFAEWFLGEINRPGFEVGLPSGLADCADREEYVNFYTAMREVLFSSPLLI